MAPRHLGPEHEALRRVAALGAGVAGPTEVFALVAEELGLLLDADTARVHRYEEDGSATIVARWDRNGSGRNLGIRQSVAAPIVIDNRLWGSVVAASNRAEQLVPDSEARIGDFMQLVAPAIANAEARAEIAALRGRALTAAAEERRRLARDLHDGAQQRLVHTILVLKMARAELDQSRDDAAACIEEALDQAETAVAELRHLSRGGLPPVLTWGGLSAAIDALASHVGIPVTIDAHLARLDGAIEANAYFVIAEALTNVAKHARAQRVAVTAQVADGELRVEVADDGVGTADPDGNGLVGLAERMRSLNGSLRVQSAPGEGTTVLATIPVRSARGASRAASRARA
jgi:signal transduction histidine kinase